MTTPRPTPGRSDTPADRADAQAGRVDEAANWTDSASDRTAASVPTATVRRITAELLAAAPRLSTTRLVLIDGPAGSGKTTLAAALSSALADAPVVHMDDLYPGWSGLAAGIDRLYDEILLPLSAGRPATYRRYDWIAGELAESHTLTAPDVLIVEGCGCGARRTSTWANLLLWIETDEAERLARGLARDGEDARPQWLRWMATEQALYAAEHTRTRATLHLNGRAHPTP